MRIIYHNLLKKDLVFILTQMPVFNNIPTSVKQFSISTDILHANQILQKSHDDVALDETTWYVPLLKMPLCS
jgi:hypothetical protein